MYTWTWRLKKTKWIKINIRSDSSSLLKLQVKQGAENMIQSLTSGRDKKLLQEAQQMLDDSRAKIEFLRMRIMKVRQARQQQHARGDAPPPNGETTSNKGTKLRDYSPWKLLAIKFRSNCRVCIYIYIYSSSDIHVFLYIKNHWPNMDDNLDEILRPIFFFIT